MAKNRQERDFGLTLYLFSDSYVEIDLGSLRYLAGRKRFGFAHLLTKELWRFVLEPLGKFSIVLDRIIRTIITYLIL